MPAVTIEDYPRFAWRGGHLDVGRHFMPKEFVLKYVDLLALHKMNMFHWHLTEDQGWRIEIKKYPRLTEVGAWRTETLVGQPSKTAETVRRHAARRLLHAGGHARNRGLRRDRFVTVVPEIEMPGHAQAAIAAVPGTRRSRANRSRSPTRWGVIENVYNAERHHRPVPEGRAHRGDGAFPGPVHPRRRRRSSQETVEGEPRARRGSRNSG